jgi:hypothetical protein
MVARKIACCACILCISTGVLFAQVVEKLSASFSFPTTTSAYGVKTAASPASFFRTGGRFTHKGIVNLEWSVPRGAAQGFISVYSVSGALVKKALLTKNQGSMQCDLSRAGAGVYLVTISYGTYRQNLKLALYK